MLSQTGVPVFKLDERLLCSRFDPVKEAKSWVEFHSEDFANTQTIVLLGLGSGYHAVEILKRFPQKKLIVLELNDQLAHQVMAFHRLDLASAQIITGSVSEINKSSRLQKALSQIYCVVDFKSATALDSDNYESLKNYLVARERLGLQYQLRLRTDLWNILDLKKVFLSDRYLLSIKDLASSIEEGQQHTEAASILNCLTGFIK